MSWWASVRLRLAAPETPRRWCLRRPVLGEYPLHRRRRVGVGLTLGVFGGVVDGGRDLGRQPAQHLVGQDPRLGELLAEARQRILAALGGQLFLRAVLRLLVVGG